MDATSLIQRLEQMTDERRRLERMMLRLEEVIAQRDALLVACETLCNAIKFFGQCKCDFNHDGPSLEFIEENWQDSTLPYLLDAYREGQAAIAEATTDRASPGPLPKLP